MNYVKWGDVKYEIRIGEPFIGNLSEVAVEVQNSDVPTIRWGLLTPRNLLALVHLAKPCIVYRRGRVHHLGFWNKTFLRG